MTDRSLALTALITLIVGTLGSLIILIFEAVIALIFAGVAILLTFIFGIVSWKEKVARVAVLTAGAFVGVALLMTAFLFLEGQGEAKKDVHRKSIELSSQDHLSDHQKIQRIGQDLLKGEEDGELRTEGLVNVEAGLRGELRELKASLEDPEVLEVKKGDLPEPYGDGRADALLKLGEPDHFIRIRLRFDAGKDAYHVLGWKSGP